MALETQESGSHYTKLAIQPMLYSMANNLDACQHTAIKYITRFRDKGGLEDLKKAVHTIEMLMEIEYGYVRGNDEEPILPSKQSSDGESRSQVPICDCRSCSAEEYLASYLIRGF